MTNRAELRRMIGRRLGDARFVTVTSVPSGSATTTFADYINLAVPGGSMVGRIAYVASAVNSANVGQQRQIVNNDEDAYTATVNPAFPAAVSVGDFIELYNMNDMGPLPGEIHDAISDALEEIKKSSPTSAFDETITSYDADADGGGFALSEAMDVVSKVYYWNGYSWVKVPAKNWDVDEVNWVLYLKNEARMRAGGMAIRYFGHAYLSLPNNDTTEIDVDKSWVANQASFLLCDLLEARSSDHLRDMWRNKKITYQQQTMERDQSVITRISGKKRVRRS